MSRHIAVCGAVLAFIALFAAACAPRGVSFSADVRPILEKHCIECHAPGGAGYEASAFDVSNHPSLLKGGKFGPFVVPGDTLGSNLIILVEGRADPSIQMPHGRTKLDEQEIEVLKAWVEQGAKNN
jgi:mono/diheme cytochrome c family protein